MQKIAALACPQNKYCGWEAHWQRDNKFPALTDELLRWRGITDCIAGDWGSICTIIDSQSCLFYKWHLKPNLEEAYEVWSLLGYACTPESK